MRSDFGNLGILADLLAAELDQQPHKCYLRMSLRRWGGNFHNRSMMCPHCKNWGIECDDTHCPIAGPGAPGKRECRMCWLRLGGNAAIPAQRPLLGDWIARLLSKIGFKKKCKPCMRRQQKLNRFHRWILERFNR